MKNGIRPKGPDFNWFLRDLIRCAENDFGYRPSPDVSITYESILTNPLFPRALTSKQYRDTISTSIDVRVLRQDWKRYLQGHDINHISPEYCLDNVLLRLTDDLKAKYRRYGEETNSTKSNAHALSLALHETLPKELTRHKGDLEDKLRSEKWLSQAEVAGLLGLKSTRRVRQLAKQGLLDRHSNGKVSAASVRTYRQAK